MPLGKIIIGSVEYNLLSAFHRCLSAFIKLYRKENCLIDKVPEPEELSLAFKSRYGYNIDPEYFRYVIEDKDISELVYMNYLSSSLALTIIQSVYG